MKKALLAGVAALFLAPGMMIIAARAVAADRADAPNKSSCINQGDDRESLFRGDVYWNRNRYCDLNLCVGIPLPGAHSQRSIGHGLRPHTWKGAVDRDAPLYKPPRGDGLQDRVVQAVLGLHHGWKKLARNHHSRFTASCCPRNPRCGRARGARTSPRRQWLPRPARRRALTVNSTVRLSIDIGHPDTSPPGAQIQNLAAFQHTKSKIRTVGAAWKTGVVLQPVLAEIRTDVNSWLGCRRQRHVRAQPVYVQAVNWFKGEFERPPQDPPGKRIELKDSSALEADPLWNWRSRRLTPEKAPRAELLL